MAYNPFQKIPHFPQVCPFLSPTGRNELQTAGAMSSFIIGGQGERESCTSWFGDLWALAASLGQ